MEACLGFWCMAVVGGCVNVLCTDDCLTPATPCEDPRGARKIRRAKELAQEHTVRPCVCVEGSDCEGMRVSSQKEPGRLGDG